jgi:Ni2+-binding GTPase involved in maturation of urease and hydrogenase
MTEAGQIDVLWIHAGLSCDGTKAATEDWRLDPLDLLFSENVGNLVCPASYDLGENLRLVLLSKPRKYPTIFQFCRRRDYHKDGSRSPPPKRTSSASGPA